MDSHRLLERNSHAQLHLVGTPLVLVVLAFYFRNV
jgi:hypothetical protein